MTQPDTMIVSANNFSSNTILTIPRGLDGLEPLRIDMTEVNRIENRIEEMRRATPITAGDLIVDFNIGMLKIGSIIATVEIELKQAENSYKEERAMATLDRVEDFLKKKELKSSADTREAAVLVDPKVKAAKQKFDILTAISSWLNTRRDSIEKAYFSTKTIADYNTTNMPMLTGGR